MFESLEGVILAGGRSERMGHDKASMIVDGLSLVERTIQALQPLASNTVVAGPQVPLVNGNLETHVTWLPDEDAFSGPVAALKQAALTTTAEWLLVLPCDLAEPMKAAEWLASQPQQPDVQAYIARDVENHVQWLTAVIKRQALIEALIEAGTTDVPVRRILSNLSTVFVDPPAENAGIWQDMDTPDDVQRHHGDRHA